MLDKYYVKCDIGNVLNFFIFKNQGRHMLRRPEQQNKKNHFCEQLSQETFVFLLILNKLRCTMLYITVYGILYVVLRITVNYTITARAYCITQLILLCDTYVLRYVLYCRPTMYYNMYCIYIYKGILYVVQCTVHITLYLFAQK